MNITINEDLTAFIEDGKGRFCRLSSTNPLTLRPFSSKAEIQGFIDTQVIPNAVRYLGAPPTVEEKVTEKRQQIETDRDAGINDEAATVLVGGVTFQTSPKSMTQLNDALTVFTALGGTPEGYEWRDESNTNHPANLALLASIAAARATQVNQYWQTSWTRKAVLDAVDLTAPDALAQIEAV